MGRSFYGKRCGHCRAIAEDWEKLAKDWQSHPIGLVAEVDCTSDEGEAICADFDVQVRTSQIDGKFPFLRKFSHNIYLFTFCLLPHSHSLLLFLFLFLKIIVFIVYYERGSQLWCTEIL